jgi:hypothetical protein
LIVFEYLLMLRENFDNVTTFYNEQKLISETWFRWKEKVSIFSVMCYF